MFRLNCLVFSIVLLIVTSSSARGQIGSQITGDKFGNSYAAGNFRKPFLTFGEFKLQNSGGSDIFIAKYDKHGKILWARNIGGKGDENLESININDAEGLSITVSSGSKIINTDQTAIVNDLDRKISDRKIFEFHFGNEGKLVKYSEKNSLRNRNSSLLKTAETDTFVSLISPEAGDNWKVGTKATIIWNSENIGSVLIEMSTDNGGTWDQLFTADVYDFKGEYNLIVPNIHSNFCLVRVSDSGNPGIADTSGTFSISGDLFWEVKESGFSSVLISSFITNSLTGWMAGFNGLLKTTDQGETWNSILTGYGLLDIFFLNDSLGWTVGLSGIIFKTTDGGRSWAEQDSVINSYLVKIFFADDENGYMLGGNNFLNTTNGGASWQVQQPTEHNLMTMFFIDKDEGWIAGNEGVLLKTTNGGLSWEDQLTAGTRYGTLTSLYFIDRNTGFASGSGLDVDGGVILKTTDSGQNWNLMHNGYNRFIFSVQFTGGDSGWAAGDEGIMFNTIDGGLNWELQGSGTFDDLLAVNIKTNDAGWTVGNNGIILKYHQDPIDPPLPVELISFAAVNRNGGIDLNWSTATETNNKGFEIEKRTAGKWMTIGFVQGKGTTVLPQTYSFTDQCSIPGEYLYRLKQVNFDGTFEYSEILILSISPQFSFKLEQNYPNPFNPSTTINFAVPENVPVSLKIYDALGSEVAALINEEKQAGQYQVNFNAAGLSSGIYFYLLKAGNFVSTKKMLLVK